MNNDNVEHLQKIVDSLESIRVNMEALKDSGYPITEDLRNANNLCKAAAAFVINHVTKTATTK